MYLVHRLLCLPELNVDSEQMPIPRKMLDFVVHMALVDLLGNYVYLLLRKLHCQLLYVLGYFTSRKERFYVS